MTTVRYRQFDTASTRRHNLQCAADGQRSYTNGLGRRLPPPSAVTLANTALPMTKPRLRQGVVVGVFVPVKPDVTVRD